MKRVRPGWILVREKARQRERDTMRQMEAQLEAWSRTSTLGALAAAVAHEIRQPLAAIGASAGAAQRWLSRTEPDHGEVDQAVQQIQHDVERAERILRGVASLVQQDTPTHQPVHIHTVAAEVRTIAQWLMVDHPARIDVLVSDTLPPIMGDAIQLQQLLLNLLINSVQALQDSDGATRRITITARAGTQGWLAIEVRDNGPGIPAHLSARVFEPFFSTRPGGMGMGLWLCRRIARNHGGELGAQSNARGTTMRLCLPVLDPAHCPAGQ